MARIRVCGACAVEYEHFGRNDARCRPCHKIRQNQQYRDRPPHKKAETKARVLARIGTPTVCRECGNTYKFFGVTSLLCRTCYRLHAKMLARSRPKHKKTARNTQKRMNEMVAAARFAAWKVAQGGCCQCAENNPECLDLHHRDPNEKEFRISRLAREGTWDKLMKEAAKCIVVCANCHRKLHEKLRKEEKVNKRVLSEKYHAVYTRKRYKKKVDRFESWKIAQGGCCRCVETTPICLDFHHRVPHEKSFNISRGLRRWYSWNEIMEETAKCIIVCANCHRKLHAKLREEEKE